jgi:hypothetical protein
MILAPGELTIGRDAECEIQIADERASRRHAVLHVGANEASVEDLASRNGVWVDGVRVEGWKKLRHGSVIAIGDTRLVLLDSVSRQGQARTAQSLVVAKRPVSGVTAGITQTGPSLGSLTLAAGAAMRAGEVGELRSAISLLLDYLAREDARADSALSDALAVATEGALSIASTTREPAWIDRIFEANGKYFRVLDRETIHSIHELARELARGEPIACASYIARLRSRTSPLDPNEVRELRRLEAMKHALAAR